MKVLVGWVMSSSGERRVFACPDSLCQALLRWSANVVPLVSGDGPVACDTCGINENDFNEQIALSQSVISEILREERA